MTWHWGSMMSMPLLKMYYRQRTCSLLTGCRFRRFCCALLADKTKDILQIKQYFKEVCKYLNQSLSIDNEGYTPHLVRLMIESHMHDAQFIDHRPEDSHFIKSYAGADVNPYLVRLGKELIENLPQSTK